MEWLVNWFEGFVDWLALVAQGFMNWSVLCVQDFTRWLLSFLQNSWPVVIDALGVVIKNPETVAISLGVIVLIILLGLIIGTRFVRSIGEDKPSEPGDGELDSVFYDPLDDDAKGVISEEDQMLR